MRRVSLKKLKKCQKKSTTLNYIKLFRETGFFALTIPEHPTNPENRYTRTEAGKQFLGCMI